MSGLDQEAIDAITLRLVHASMPFDICCTVAMPGRGSRGRCQLWAGHVGNHAVMIVRDGQRVVLTWRDHDLASTSECIDYRRLPWARGFPLPAWHERAPTANGEPS